MNMMMNDTIPWTFSLLRFLLVKSLYIYIFFLLFMTQNFSGLWWSGWQPFHSQHPMSYAYIYTMGLYQSMREWESLMTLHSISCDIRIHLFVCKLQLHSKPKTKNKKGNFYVPPLRFEVFTLHGEFVYILTHTSPPVKYKYTYNVSIRGWICKRLLEI